jgi:hypothetical protein
VAGATGRKGEVATASPPRRHPGRAGHAPARLLGAAIVAALAIAGAARLLAPAGGAGPAGGITIVADPGPFSSVEAAAAAEGRVVWRDGDPRDDDACTGCFAATELRRHLAAALRVPDSSLALSGAAVLPAAGRVVLLTSDPADPRLSGLDTTGAPPLPSGDGQGFRVFTATSPGRVVHVIQGAGREGTLYGVYTLLERLGVRFYAPGVGGRALPPRPPTLPARLSLAERPAYLTRGFWAWEPRGDPDFLLWMARNRLNLWTAAEPDLPLLRKLGIRLTQGGHAVQKTFLDPAAPYPYRHARAARSAMLPPDPCPVSPECLGDRDADGRLSYFEAHPEWYGLVDGKRSERVGTDSGDNFCTSNDDAVRELTKNLVAALERGAWQDADELVFWMHDDGRWCACPHCRELGTPTDRLLRLLAQVRRALDGARAAGTLRHPVMLTSLAFLETMAPPTRPVPPELGGPGVALTYFPIDRCYAHALADPRCTEINQAQCREFEAWAADPGRAYRGAIAVGEYYNVSSLRSLPFVYTRILRADLPWYFRHGVRHFHYMHVPTRDWGPLAVDHALLARLLWDPDADADAILDAYFAGRYPVTRASTRRFYESLERATANFKLLKGRVRTPRAIYGLARQIRAGQEPLPLEHLRYQSFHPARNDAPDLQDMQVAMGAARVALDRSLALGPRGAERARLAEDDRRLRYAEATLDFFDHLVRLCAFDRRGDVANAAAEWRALDAVAGRLRLMTDASRWAGRDANATDGLQATEAVDLYEAYGRTYGGR